MVDNVERRTEDRESKAIAHYAIVLAKWHATEAEAEVKDSHGRMYICSIVACIKMCEADINCRSEVLGSEGRLNRDLIDSPWIRHVWLVGVRFNTSDDRCSRG
ncbi:hypothetical protein CHS0354_017864 [Potamilus streckersoni]|uniref:Uncharacterized protein n=1 Tax=Potamilus streckersoni TaxID=2493646 RepID=A0AAE0VKJ3_9BIVA|nr:hypothetical protein CHS0354_013890 [Potamilus streckersoni]KAK3600188.1 hypothetical protein CHS0354_001904 [Potamilus streckersoni]KAK3604756.1 hypothetical protein CHS0354_017864 [Potamilus streckersoni]